MKPFFKTALFGTALLLFSTSVTRALDKDAFVASFEQYAAENGLSNLQYEKIDMDGSTIILRNAQVNYDFAGKLPLGDMVFNKVEETKDGGYAIGAWQIGRIETDLNASKLEIKNLSVNNMYLPAKDSGDSDRERAPYTTQTVEQIRIYGTDQATFTFADIDTRLLNFKANELTEGEIKIGSFEFDPSPMPVARRQHFNDLGYDKITGTITGLVNNNVKTGDITVSDFVISARDTGTLTLNMKLGGFTRATIEKINNLEENNNAALALMQQLNFTNYSLRFEDHSLTNRVLDQAGKQQGLSREGVITGATQAVTQIASNLGEAKIGKKLAPEISAFLKNPKSLQISFSLSQPMPFLAIMMGAAASPADLLDQLNADIIANK
ncbi:MAG: Hypothetical protein BHV28_09490 [Candidatus Tokpelaia hoelldobleri]|uniref:Uncharacterized protein n=1 Tax=Candidatus Tokpelaia hoelldobleri TaxID=1902579 RepID=A0A1U9JUT7_9HYPH|nr:MAG: Hypothetical protein BHV28_09490 [Candidatus Tokpelaia hoelldoblerii]